METGFLRGSSGTLNRQGLLAGAFLLFLKIGSEDAVPLSVSRSWTPGWHVSHPMPTTRVGTHRHTQIRTRPSPASTMFRKHHFRRRKGTSYRTRRTVSRRGKGEGGNSKGGSVAFGHFHFIREPAAAGRGRPPGSRCRRRGGGRGGRPLRSLPQARGGLLNGPRSSRCLL